ncbi:MAG: 50S ribosomal protein L3 N(5)-glutamine methyltransferase [Betaproteobacteria bacterium]|nr:50S ribosomal protein L3 N(5)-glutamine methyltransferase [Betaproteobacteria bacterium]
MAAKSSLPFPELLTLRDFLRHAVSQFNAAGLIFGHGSDNAWDEAVYLLLHTLHLPLDRLEPFLDARLTADERGAALKIIDRRCRERLPAAYLTREAWLGEYRFYVDERVIVPRSFIAELLLRDALELWLPEPEGIDGILDLCTGSGCLAILSAIFFPQAAVDAVDISADALEVAQKNVADYELQAQVHLHRGDLYAPVSGRLYDLIVSNPPYVNARAMKHLPPEYRHEPALALASGADGLQATRRILSDAAAHLKPGGVLIVEIGHNRAALEKAFPKTPFTWLETSAGDGHVFLLRREELP